jgi:hypothetical protein
MRITTTTARHVFVLGFASALLTAYGCSSGGGDGGTTMLQLTCHDGGAAAANAVALKCGGRIGVTERVDVVIGGPAAGSTTLSGLNFDVTYDSSKLVFVSASGDTSDLFSPSALVGAAVPDGQPGRVVVSIQQAGGDPDVTVVAGQHVVMSLSFRVAAGATFGATPLAFDASQSEATNPSTAISFASGLTLAHQ